MLSDNTNNHYDVLEISSDATPQEIREAYLKLKATYSKDSLALYSLIDSSESESLLKKIEIAYQILSHPEKRKEYDKKFGFIQAEDIEDSFVHTPQKIISIDRTPPMETIDQEALLIAPQTDFTEVRQTASPPPTSTPISPPTVPSEPIVENNWDGSTIKKFREMRGLSFQEVSDLTKISRTYLKAIEEEDYKKLPAYVYIRGFITQIAKTLKIPAEQLVEGYLKKYKQNSQETK